MKTETTTMRQLQRGDTIVCRGDGRTENVLFVRTTSRGHVVVRTSRHDHHRLTTDPVERVAVQRVCALCGGDGWTDSSAELRRDGHVGDTTCIGCGGSGFDR